MADAVVPRLRERLATNPQRYSSHLPVDRRDLVAVLDAAEAMDADLARVEKAFAARLSSRARWRELTGEKPTDG